MSTAMGSMSPVASAATAAAFSAAAIATGAGDSSALSLAWRWELGTEADAGKLAAMRSERFRSARSRARLLLLPLLHGIKLPRELLRLLDKDRIVEGRLGHLVLAVSTLAERPKGQLRSA